jgi:hypothetical protein
MTEKHVETDKFDHHEIGEGSAQRVVVKKSGLLRLLDVVNVHPPFQL